MKTIILLITLVVAISALHAAGPQAPKAQRAPGASNHFLVTPAPPADVYALASPLLEPFPPSMGNDNPDDPAYSLYKEGYNLILDEDWDAARKKLASVISKYPKSEYVDDAAYWSAYAMRSIDRKKAIVEYKEFIAKYPNSSYFDDAVADLSQLTGKSKNTVSIYDWGSGAATAPGTIYYNSDSTTGFVTGTGGKLNVYKAPKGATAYTISPDLDVSVRRLERDARRLAKAPRALTMPGVPKVWGLGGSHFFDEEKLDPKTRLKMDALRALGDTKEDSISYRTLRDVATDQKQPRELRITALDALSEFRKFDVLPVFLQVAKNDPDPDVQNIAIDVISDLGGGKNRSVEALIDLYNSLPSSRKEQRESIFYAIADIGNDKAVDFLAKVARSSDDYELRSQAIYYLGNIGGERARAALYEILKEN